MRARHAARELALILFSQLDLTTPTQNNGFQPKLVESVRTLTNSSMEDLESSVNEILAIKSFMRDYESNHPKNLQRPIGVSDKPVEIPMTDDMIKKLDSLVDIAERIMLALEIAEMTVLEENSEVKGYIKHVTKEFLNHKSEIDAQIKKFAIGWDINRLVKMDRDILRLTICELLYVKKAPIKVILDEAVELAKKCSTDDSASFINGILAKVVIDNDLK